MNIKELEDQSGITKQNIRFYEKKGLLRPNRNPENDYRVYTQDDLEILRKIKVLRLLDVSIPDIKKYLEQKEDLQTIIMDNLVILKQKEEEVKASIEICNKIIEENFTELPVDLLLKEVEQKQSMGARFINIVKDYKKLANSEAKKVISFMPDTMIYNAREFTEALLEFAKEQNYEIIITKESMYPEFQLNGIEYTANRIFSRYGAVVRCEIVDESVVEDIDIPDKRKKYLKFVYRLIPCLFLLLFYLIFIGSREFTPISILIGLIITFIFYVFIRYYYNLK